MKENSSCLPAPLTAHCLRPSAPITFERPTALARTSAPSTAPRTPLLSTPRGTVLSPFALELVTGVADGFAWLIKTLPYPRSGRLAERTAPMLPTTAAPENPVQRRIQRMLREVPENLAAQAWPGADSAR